MSCKKYVLKNRSRMCVNLDTNIYDKLIEYSNKTNIPITRNLDMALEKFFDSIESEGKL